MADLKEIVLNNNTETLERILSPFIEEQFPLFVRTDYRKIVLFVKAYYEWLEQQGNPGYVLANMRTITDVDENFENFYSHFKSTYLMGFPEILTQNEDGDTINKKTLLKKIRDFYGNKGTQSAYEFLFQALYYSDVEFYYPKEDILKISDGRWIEPVSIKTTSSNGADLFAAVGGQLVQSNGSVDLASAFIESVIQYSFNGLPVTEFFLRNISGSTFVPNISVTIRTKDGKEYSEIPYSVLGEFFVEVPGSGYKVGDICTVVDATGIGFSAKVEQTGLAGGVKKIAIANSGLNYSSKLILNIFSSTGSQTALVYGLNTALTRYPGYFSGNRGKLSSNKMIQDSKYYQEFSYELKSAVSFDDYYSVLKAIAHPAGTRMFGSILVKAGLQTLPYSASEAVVYEKPVVGRYTPYTIGTTLDLRNNGVTSAGYWLGATGDLYPLGYNPYIGSTSEIGPNGKTTPNGTIFSGSSLGYTYCYVPENGNTAHNPIGAPLGSTYAWYSGKETRNDPGYISGLVLWLKPENIGVCGAVANGASMDIWRDASPTANHAVPPTWDRWTTNSTYAGVTIDKLRPTLVINDNGVAGATGIEFTRSASTATLVSPWTYWGNAANYGYTVGITLGGLGITFAPGSSGDKMLTAPHFYLTRGITLTADMDMFIVFRTKSENSDYNYSVVSSSRRAYDQFFNQYEDNCIMARSWNSVDRNPANQNNISAYWFNNGKKYYYESVGAFGFRPWAVNTISGVTANQRGAISYDPHVSTYAMGMVIGEASRDSAGNLYAWLNGDRAKNSSASTGLKMRNWSGNDIETDSPVSGATMEIGQFGGYIRHITYPANASAGGTAWIAGVTGEGAYGFWGVLNEVIVFNRKLSEPERQQVYGYLSRKYTMRDKLPKSYALSHESGYLYGITYWDIRHHPNTYGLSKIPAGISFSGISLSSFVSLPRSVYMSAGSGSTTGSGTTLGSDTYITL